MAQEEVNLVHFELRGNRNWLTGRFEKIMGAFGFGSDSRLAAAYQAKLAELGEYYKAEVARRFNESHGRTGQTATTIAKHYYILDAEEARYDINIGGGVGFVINPLPPHFITGTPGLQGMAVMHPARLRNFYSPFGPIESVYWYQGGAESYSPDDSWYTDAADALQGQGQVELRKLAAVVQEIWHEAVSGNEILTAGEF